MSLSREQAAEALGMKVREIVAVDRVDGGYAVTTHDGHRTLVGRDGRVVACGDVLDGSGALPTGAPAEQQPPVGPADRQRTREAKTTEVPTGTAAEVLAWVGADADRAKAALTVEQGQERPRVGLVAELEKITS